MATRTTSGRKTARATRKAARKTARTIRKTARKTARAMRKEGRKVELRKHSGQQLVLRPEQEFYRAESLHHIL